MVTYGKKSVNICKYKPITTIFIRTRAEWETQCGQGGEAARTVHPTLHRARVFPTVGETASGKPQQPSRPSSTATTECESASSAGASKISKDKNDALVLGGRVGRVQLILL